jgi:hypothetical protein
LIRVTEVSSPVETKASQKPKRSYK